ncbi:myeloid leukemia factor 1 isoform X2 [Sorex araneus]|uniref:myeloid leukemia factor 1 isoform X2 n=1 Tax=Sorex araneus TaxID=42254 RepID=UPI0024338461|nr:myeloid leukemia factor 1 isoform X2 [Sorex araneus]
MFGTLSRPFEDDPFFSDSFMAHQGSMRQMMRSFPIPFGRDFHGNFDGRRRARNQMGRDDGESYFNPADVNPFQAMDRMMADVGRSIQDLQRNFGKLSMDSDGHSFSSSSVMTYSKVGDEPPKVFQASTQTRRAPGGIKETRKALRDSDSGVEKMSVGHHLRDRAHVIKKSKNSRTGEEEVNQEFINMSESDALAFDDEWQSEVLRSRPGIQYRSVENGRLRSIPHDNSGSRELKKREKPHLSLTSEGGRRMGVAADRLNVKGSTVKINKK